MLTPLEERTVEDFLSHKWAVQIKMDERLEDYKLTWEVSFWNDTVSKSRNPNKNAYMKAFLLGFLDFDTVSFQEDTSQVNL